MDRSLVRASFRLVVTGVTATLALTAPVRAQGSPAGGPGWAAVQDALGARGVVQAGDVLRFGFPRSDLTVVVDHVTLKPALALGSWLAFRHGSTPTDDMVMGDLVLLEDEVNPVMQALQQGGVEQTALHNHVLHESPHVMYMHIAGHGDAAALARTLRSALSLTHTPIPSGAAAATQAPVAAIDLDTGAVSRTLGFGGRVNGGVFQVSVPRTAAITEHGMEIPPSMGVATAINFQPTGAGKAAITGDFVLTADEVNPVIRELQSHAILVTALHSHMLSESPRLFFMHFWADADAVTLARGLRAALDRMDVRRNSAP